MSSAPFKKCDVCGGKVPIQDPHSSWLLCLGKDHDTKACPLCKSMTSQARKNRESQLMSAIAQGKIHEGGQRPILALSVSTSVPIAPGSPSSVISVPTALPAHGSGEPSAVVPVARDPHRSSATSKSSKRPHERSGTEDSASVTSKDASRDASKPRSTAKKTAQPVHTEASVLKSAVTSKGKPAGSKSSEVVKISDLPTNPLFPPDTPKSSKKRSHAGTPSDSSGPKKSKTSRVDTQDSSSRKSASKKGSRDATKLHSPD